MTTERERIYDKLQSLADQVQKTASDLLDLDEDVDFDPDPDPVCQHGGEESRLVSSHPIQQRGDQGALRSTWVCRRTECVFDAMAWVLRGATIDTVYVYTTSHVQVWPPVPTPDAVKFFKHSWHLSDELGEQGKRSENALTAVFEQRFATPSSLFAAKNGVEA